MPLLSIIRFCGGNVTGRAVGAAAGSPQQAENLVVGGAGDVCEMIPGDRSVDLEMGVVGDFDDAADELAQVLSGVGGHTGAVGGALAGDHDDADKPASAG